jgi:peptidoglycan/LPS O-acetylase OafA/YrhL
MNPGNPHRQYFSALDGFRGLAAIFVITFHNFGFLIKYYSFGWIGLDMFFVLSGFLITDILLKTLEGKNYLRNFYVRRVLRIFPLYYLSLIIFLLVLPALHIELGLKYYTDNQAWLWGYMQNWLFIFKNPESNTLNHLWSLAVEEHFYLLWPLIILIIRKPRHLLVFIVLLLALVVSARIWIWYKHIPGFAYYNLYAFTRIDGICMGCMVAILLRVNKFFIKKYLYAIVLFLAAINLLFFLINRQNQFSLPYLGFAGYTTVAALFGLLVNQIISNETIVINNFFNISLLRFIGKISYSFYIFHWPVYLLITPYLSSWFGSFTSGRTTQFIVSTLATLVALAVGWLSFNYFEKYFLKLKAKFA